MAYDYTTLAGERSVTGSIKNWVNNSLIPSDNILIEAQAEIYNRLRVREMLTRVEGTLQADDSSIAVPDGYRALYSFRFTGIKKAILTKKQLYELEEMITFNADSTRSTGKPQFYAAAGNEIEFETVADEAYPYLFRYYQALPLLAEATNETNFLTDRYPYLLRYACMYRGFQFLRNPSEEGKYFKVMEDAISKANQESDYEMLGADLVMQVE